MSGECKSYRLNDPMTWKEFMSMPDDIKVTYINLLRQKYNVPDCKIGEMLGVDKCKMSTEIKRIGLGHGVKHGGYRSWDKEGFYAWLHGVDQVATPVPEAPIEEDPREDQVFCHKDGVAYAEDDLPFEEPDPIPCDTFTPVQIPVTAIPINGSMNFNCPANQALNTWHSCLVKPRSASVSCGVWWKKTREEFVMAIRLIDANDAVSILENNLLTIRAININGNMQKYIKLYEEVIDFLKNRPTVDAVEVVHGQWEEYPKDSFAEKFSREKLRCSNCLHFFYPIYGESKRYCPNCGAKMDGGVKNA